MNYDNNSTQSWKLRPFRIDHSWFKAKLRRIATLFMERRSPQYASRESYVSIDNKTPRFFTSQEWLEALQKVHFLEAMVEISQTLPLNNSC